MKIRMRQFHPFAGRSRVTRNRQVDYERSRRQIVELTRLVKTRLADGRGSWHGLLLMLVDGVVYVFLPIQSLDGSIVIPNSLFIISM